ncbi:cytochrome P450 [Catenulispora pinisilvae]|uniref:cytochrome P450 n=1 Tax=Catenulispora pinisilvae TaxID=2705253 RepID=UPI001891ED9D|nr:cytochrome P450 [Catenulispora pinisilvae]
MSTAEQGAAADAVAAFDPMSLADHHHAEQRLTEVRACCPVSQPHPRMHFLAAYADVEQVLVDNTRFSARSNFRLDATEGARPFRTGSGALPSSDPPAHTALRLRLRRWFAPRALRRLQPRVEELARAAVADLPIGVDFNLITVSKGLAAQVVYALIGLPEQDWSQLQAWSDALHETLPAPLNGTPEYQAMMARLQALIEARRRRDVPPDESVISGLAEAVEAGDLSAAEAVIHVWQLIQAGTETTSSLIANLLHTLLSDRDRWRLLQHRPELVEAAIEESLRRDAPIQYVMRTPYEPTAVSGCPIDVDEQIVIGLQSANWDREVWGADALEFDIERDRSAGHLAFGRGAHACLGAPLARMEAEAFLSELLRRRPEIMLADGYVHELAPELMVRRPTHLLLHIPN